MNIKSILNNTKLWQLITTLILGYLGYEQAVQYKEPAQDIDVEVNVPEQKQTIPIHDHEHDHEELKQLADKIRKNKQSIDTLNKWH